MIIKKVVLNNIRSYKNQEINFPESSILLSGDIGSGKTSVLLAIEFALFGLQPGQKGTSILRNGTNFGGVEMEFEIDGKNVRVERTLKKSKAISQDYCSIEIEGEKKEISVMELKDKILDLLNYPKEFSKKQNILYKFTVYTPQEEMKQIITEDSESRVNTLRHIFGIDKYKTILENTNLLASKIREEKRVKEALVTDLEGEKFSLVEKENEIRTKKNDLLVAESDFLLKKQETQKILGDREKTAKKVEERKKIKQEIEKTKIIIEGRKEVFKNNEKISNNLNLQINEAKNVNFSEEEFLRLKIEVESNKKEKDKVNNEIIRVSSEINSLSAKNNENNSLINKISNIQSCPTCLQVVKDEHKHNIIKKCEHEISYNNNNLNLLNSEKNAFLEKSKELNNDIINFEKRFQEMIFLQIGNQEIQNKILQLKELVKSNEAISLSINALMDMVERMQVEYNILEEYEINFIEANKRFDEALSQERFAEIKAAEIRREIELFEKQINEIREKIKRYEKINDEIIRLYEIENWLNQKFSFLISLIEKNVMTRLKDDFSRFFSEWFSMLVSELFTTSIDDDFSPKIEHQGHEIDYEHLSGGERTAIALAYRLALNQVINSMLSKIKTKDLVILDEPTDGFSSQQLDRMRDVLNQLNVKQLIIVSHEQKIEAFVENIIRFRKEDGVSIVEY
ncbi:hypothetical protein HY448_00045 [Candidatus Pacearchaeota archaeon]|nr:hypothetical protein [Candidatus Pacearchaeota archaeon]